MFVLSLNIILESEDKRRIFVKVRDSYSTLNIDTLRPFKSSVLNCFSLKLQFNLIFCYLVFCVIFNTIY